jgi:hypothetical protein
MRAHERRVRKVDEERDDVLDLDIRRELPSTLDDDTTALGERHDRLDAARERAGHDVSDLTIGKRPHELARDTTSRVVEAPEAVHAG